MTCDEQDAFTAAVTALKESGVYDDFVRSHAALDFSGSRIHNSPDFFPWHRWQVYVFERELQRVADSCDMFVPYWSWVSHFSWRMYPIVCVLPLNVVLSCIFSAVANLGARCWPRGSNSSAERRRVGLVPGD